MHIHRALQTVSSTTTYPRRVRISSSLWERLTSNVKRLSWKPESFLYPPLLSQPHPPLPAPPHSCLSLRKSHWSKSQEKANQVWWQIYNVCYKASTQGMKDTGFTVIHIHTIKLHVGQSAIDFCLSKILNWQETYLHSTLFRHVLLLLSFLSSH